MTRAMIHSRVRCKSLGDNAVGNDEVQNTLARLFRTTDCFGTEVYKQVHPYE